jgi:hypothetical protein
MSTKATLRVAGRVRASTNADAALLESTSGQVWEVVAPALFFTQCNLQPSAEELCMEATVEAYLYDSGRWRLDGKGSFAQRVVLLQHEALRRWRLVTENTFRGGAFNCCVYSGMVCVVAKCFLQWRDSTNFYLLRFLSQEDCKTFSSVLVQCCGVRVRRSTQAALAAEQKTQPETPAISASTERKALVASADTRPPVVPAASLESGLSRVSGVQAGPPPLPGVQEASSLQRGASQSSLTPAPRSRTGSFTALPMAPAPLAPGSDPTLRSRAGSPAAAPPSAPTTAAAGVGGPKPKKVVHKKLLLKSRAKSQPEPDERPVGIMDGEDSEGGVELAPVARSRVLSLLLLCHPTLLPS